MSTFSLNNHSMSLRSMNGMFEQFQCCGIAGLSEFASKLDPIDESCYRIEYIRNGTGTDAQITPIREPNRVSLILYS